MVSKVRLYVEGGGDSRHLWRKIREGFRAFLDPRSELGLEIIPCGSRAETFKDFRLGLKVSPDAFNLLLVDSDGKVSLSRWEHLRRQTGWSIPKLHEDHCHFMAQSTEAWLAADPQALVDYYGKGFRRNALPSVHTDIEAVSREDLLQRLSRAAAGTQKKGYLKIRHCAELLKRLDPNRVRQRAHHCELLFRTLENPGFGRHPSSSERPRLPGDPS